MLVLENEYLINAEWAFRWGGGQWAESSELHLCPGTGSVPAQRRAFTVPTLLLFYLLSNVLLYFTIPLLCSISWPIIFLCTLAVSYQSSLPLDPSLLLICVSVTCSQTPANSQHNVRGHLSVFQNIEKTWAPCLSAHVSIYDYLCITAWEETWGRLVTCMTSEGSRMSFNVVHE